MNTAEMSFHFPAILFATLAICGWCDQLGLACTYPSQPLVLETIYHTSWCPNPNIVMTKIIPLNYKNKYGFIPLLNNYILNSAQKELVNSGLMAQRRQRPCCASHKTQKDYTSQYKAVKHHNQKSCHTA